MYWRKVEKNHAPQKKNMRAATKQSEISVSVNFNRQRQWENSVNKRKERLRKMTIATAVL